MWTLVVQVSERQSLMVLSFSKLAEAIMFSVGWQAVHNTTSVCPAIHRINSPSCLLRFCYITLGLSKSNETAVNESWAINVLVHKQVPTNVRQTPTW
jgi:hypothetical protein